MTSDKQRAANRANAKRSTGPKTAAGKAVSRMNACKHALTAETVVIGDEDPREFDSLRADLEQEFEPQPGIERELVERLATHTWRLRRMPVFEAALIESRRLEVEQTPADADEENRRKKFAEIAKRYLPPDSEVQSEEASEVDKNKPERQKQINERSQGAIGGLALILDNQKYQDALGKLSRYETTLLNGFTRTLQQLLYLKAQRDRNEDFA